MTFHAGLAARHINSYHYNPSLLFQFILAEFTESFAELKNIETICTREQTGFDHDKVKASLIKLVGSPREHMRLLSWNFSDGTLAKLRTYCTLFLQSTEMDTKELMALQHYADKICQACIQSLEMLGDHQLERTSFIAILEKAHSSMQRFAKLISRLIHQFRDDENVIYFIVKNHKLFDMLYGARFVNKLLGRLYPKGIREAQHHLVKRYTARGFDQVVAAVHTNFAEIEAGAL